MPSKRLLFTAALTAATLTTTSSAAFAVGGTEFGVYPAQLVVGNPAGLSAGDIALRDELPPSAIRRQSLPTTRR